VCSHMLSVILTGMFCLFGGLAVTGGGNGLEHGGAMCLICRILSRGRRGGGSRLQLECWWAEWEPKESGIPYKMSDILQNPKPMGVEIPQLMG
jgi:hypothetical protein